VILKAVWRADQKDYVMVVRLVDLTAAMMAAQLGTSKVDVTVVQMVLHTADLKVA